MERKNFLCGAKKIMVKGWDVAVNQQTRKGKII